MYKNTSYSSIWFYAYVTDIRFESNNSCSCQLKTDVFQTWMFDYTLKKSFIERSHVPKSSDTIGAYTVPEGLETGEYKVYSHMADSTTAPDCVILGTSVDFETSSTGNIVYYNGVYNGLVSGCGYYRFELQNLNGLMDAIGDLAQLGESDSIVTMFMYPSAWAPLIPGVVSNKVQTGSTPISKNYGISRISSLDGYTPKNAKCLTYPYCYIVLSNGVGTANVYHQEVWDIDTNTQHETYGEMVVHADAVLCPGGSAKVYPLNYNGTQKAIDEGFSLGKFPQLSWQVDLYTNWEVQNGINLFGTPLTATEYGLAGNTLKAISNFATGNPVMGASALRGIFDTMQEQYRHSLIAPGIGGNINSGDVSAITGTMAFQFQRCGVKAEFARNIDNFFEMFGYKLNKVDTINTSSRSNWNFIKTIDVNMTGDIPERDLQELKDLYNGGFTIWHTTTYFMDYSQTNA